MTTQLVTTQESSVTLGGQIIPVFSWQVDLGTYGQLGRATAKTSIALLQEFDIDIAGLTQNQTYAPLDISLNGQTVFGGSYFASSLSFHDDELEIWARDHAAILFDTKRSIADLNVQNRRVSDLVRDIATQYGLQADVQVDDDPRVGTLVQQGGVMATYPQPLWNLVVYLARLSGANVWTTPDGQLVFHSQSEQQQQRQYTWLAGPPTGQTQQSQLDPVLRLTVLHQPQRNRHFSVIVKSHHQKTAQDATATVTVAGQNIILPASALQSGNTLKVGLKSIPAGTYTGTGGRNVRSVLSSAGLGIPEFIFYEPGLTADQAQAHATGYANEIAKRLLVYEVTVEGNADIRPLEGLQVNEGRGGALLGFGGRPLFITGVQHHFQMPQDEGVGEGGYLTTMHAMNIPPSAVSTGELGGALSG